MELFALHQGRVRAKMTYDDIDMYESIVELLDFDPAASTFLLIPVHAREQNLARCIEVLGTALANQPINVVFCVNYVASSDEDLKELSESASGLAALIDSSPKAGCLRRVHFTRELSGPPRMGEIRAFMCDVVLEFCRRRGISRPLMICQDVDVLGIAGDYFCRVLDNFKQRPDLAMLAGPVYYGYKGLEPVGLPGSADVPELFLFQRMSEAFATCLREGRVNFEHRVWPEGANLVVTGRAYAATGGFDRDAKAGEDDRLGRQIHKFAVADRFRRQSLQMAFDEGAWLVTDPRRILRSISLGRPGIEAWAWDDFAQSPGAAMSTHDLSLACEQRGDLITTKDLERAVRGNGDALAKVQRRVVELFEKFAVFDQRAQTSEQVKAWTHSAGLATIECDYRAIERSCRLEVDWDGSAILADLLLVGRRHLRPMENASGADSWHPCSAGERELPAI